MTALRNIINWIARTPTRAFLIIFLLGFSIRLLCLPLVPESGIAPHTRWENAAIATSLVERGQFADPYMIPTGPTAHLPPLVPAIDALFWSLFGMNLAGGYAAWIFSMICFSILYAMLPWIAGRVGIGRQAGVLGGLVGSLIILPSGNGEEAAGISLGLLSMVFLHRWRSGPGAARYSFLLGTACGVAFHLQPVLLPVVLGWTAFELWHDRDSRKWRLSALMIVGMFMTCIPWGWRNYTVFDKVFFIRGNLGLELRMANHEGATGAADVMGARKPFRHPRTHPVEAQKVLELGEAEYMRQAKVEAIEWIKNHPGMFLQLTGSRLLQFWLGPMHQPWVAFAVTLLTILAVLGAWRSLPAMTSPQRAALMTPLIFYPLIYYIVMYMPRYRIPLDWILLMLAGAAVWRWIDRQ